jgi:hypothetical protein
MQAMVPPSRYELPNSRTHRSTAYDDVGSKSITSSSEISEAYKMNVLVRPTRLAMGFAQMRFAIGCSSKGSEPIARFL